MSKQKELEKLIEELYSSEKYNQARKLIYSALNLNVVDMHQLELHGLLIDIATRIKSETDLQHSILYLSQNEEEILLFITLTSYYYNLANAYSTLGNLRVTNNKDSLLLENQKENLQPQIDLYWRAIIYRSDDSDELYPEIEINLSNALMASGRILEAVYFFDKVIVKMPNFKEALISKADLLYYLWQNPYFGTSVALSYEIARLYEKGLQQNDIPADIKERVNENLNIVQSYIREEGYTSEDIDQELAETRLEYENHSKYRQFSLQEYLTLNEHSLYCHCSRATVDDLTIGLEGLETKDDAIPQVELLINRVKMEYGIARLLYFKSAKPDCERLDVRLTDLHNGIQYSSNIEYLRSAYRTCYSILDKLAIGLCKLFNIYNPKDKIYFESFWRKSEYWNNLNKQSNIYLASLYSIAANLNPRTGMLKEFKTWRNSLEHGVLELVSADSDYDTFSFFIDDNFIKTVDIKLFEKKVVHLMQLTRSAIYSFVMCARTDKFNIREQDTSGFAIDFKTDL